ncbi:tetratricopeptide repeat protein, partial [Klebsiella pneumoniae]
DMIRAYAALGVPDDIVGATAKTKPNEIHFLTRSELNAMVNNPAPPEEFTNYLISTNQSVETTKLIQTSLPSEESKNYSRDLNERGINLIHTGNYDEAVKVLEEAKKHNNFDTEVLGNLGYAYYRNNDLKNAQDN